MDPCDLPSTSCRTILQDSCHASTAASQGKTNGRYLCYFLHRLLDFRMPELRALAGMFGVQQLEVEALPEGEQGFVDSCA